MQFFLSISHVKFVTWYYQSIFKVSACSLDVIKSTNIAAIIDQFERLFSIFVYPELIKHDNSPPFGTKYSRMDQVKFVEDSL